MSDLIDRQEAIDALYAFWSGCSFDGDGYDIADKSEDVLRDLPSAQPERKNGKWIDGKVKHIKNGELRNVRECSECGSSYFVYDNYNSIDEIPNYCPNCGSYNGGEEDE